MTQEVRGRETHLKPAQRKAVSVLDRGDTAELTREHYQQIAGVSRSQAAYDLAGLVEAGILVRVGAGRTTRYRLARRKGSPKRRWTQERIRAELTQFCSGRTQWPSASDFKRAGRGDLYVAASRYGGIAFWATELGFAPSPTAEPPPAAPTPEAGTAATAEPADVARSGEPADLAPTTEPPHTPSSGEPAYLAPIAEPPDVAPRAEPAQVAPRAEPADLTPVAAPGDAAATPEPPAPAPTGVRQEPAPTDARASRRSILPLPRRLAVPLGLVAIAGLVAAAIAVGVAVQDRHRPRGVAVFADSTPRSRGARPSWASSISLLRHEVAAPAVPAKRGSASAPPTILLKASRGRSWVSVRAATGKLLYQGVLKRGRRLRFRGEAVWMRVRGASNLDTVIGSRRARSLPARAATVLVNHTGIHVLEAAAAPRPSASGSRAPRRRTSSAPAARDRTSSATAPASPPAASPPPASPAPPPPSSQAPSGGRSARSDEPAPLPAPNRPSQPAPLPAPK